MEVSYKRNEGVKEMQRIAKDPLMIEKEERICCTRYTQD